MTLSVVVSATMIRKSGEGRAAHGTCTKLVVPCMGEWQTGDATPGSSGARREMEQGPTSLLFTASKPSAKQPPPSLLPNPPPTIPIRSLPPDDSPGEVRNLGRAYD
jgi:hypothetical protein